MRTGLTRAAGRGLVAALVAAAGLAVTAPAALAAPSCEGLNCNNHQGPSATPDGFYASVGQAVHALNNGGSTSGGPPPCSEEDLVAHVDPDPEVNHTGHLQYVTPLNSQEVLNGFVGDAGGTWWRLVCVFDDGFVPFDDLVDINFFEEITGDAVAGYAVDQALTRVPAPQPRMSPDSGDQLVNLPTYLWVDGIPDTAFPGPSVSVPGITVTVEVSTGGVYWVLGDGNELACEINAPGTPTCSHTYRRSSATEPDLQFHGSASVRWTARYWVNGAGPYEVADAVVRQTPFAVRVAEGQAVVTG